MPEAGPWGGISDPGERLARALDEFYGYYERTAPMFANVLRNAEPSESLRSAVVPLEAYLDEVTEILAAGWPTRGRRRNVLMAALRHAIDFTTWRSLTRNDHIARGEAVALIGGLVGSAAAPSRPSGASRRAGERT